MTMKKPSLRTIIENYLGMLPDSGLDYQTLQKLIQDGEIHSAYSHVKNKTEFSMVRWGPLEVQNWSEFQRLFKDGILSFEHDSLGELLQTLNFYGTETMVETVLVEELYDQHKREEDIESIFDFLKTRLGINPAKQHPFFAQGYVKVNTLVDFVSEWWDQGGHKSSRWNPDYAQPLKSEKFYDFIRKNKPQHYLEELNQETDYVSVSQADWDEDVHLGTFHNSFYSPSILLPFDGWTLAECFRIHYKK